MSPGHPVEYFSHGCFPRVSGDEPSPYPDANSRPEFSPRERG